MNIRRGNRLHGLDPEVLELQVSDAYCFAGATNDDGPRAAFANRCLVEY
jgi:hypothetical protein